MVYKHAVNWSLSFRIYAQHGEYYAERGGLRLCIKKSWKLHLDHGKFVFLNFCGDLVPLMIKQTKIVHYHFLSSPPVELLLNNYYKGCLDLCALSFDILQFSPCKFWLLVGVLQKRKS